MRSVKKWRHYCDFCGKAKMVKPTMVKHELGCTLNPARVCGICRLAENEQASMEALKAALVEDNGNMKRLREVASNCPVCMLAAIRQYNKNTDFDDAIWPDFDFKAEMKSFWDDYNESQREHYAYG